MRIIPIILLGETSMNTNLYSSDCVSCQNSNFCKRCIRCKNCFNCVECSDCTFVSNCKGWKNITKYHPHKFVEKLLSLCRTYGEVYEELIPFKDLKTLLDLSWDECVYFQMKGEVYKRGKASSEVYSLAVEDARLNYDLKLLKKLVAKEKSLIEFLPKEILHQL